MWSGPICVVQCGLVEYKDTSQPIQPPPAASTPSASTPKAPPKTPNATTAGSTPVPLPSESGRKFGVKKEIVGQGAGTKRKLNPIESAIEERGRDRVAIEKSRAEAEVKTGRFTTLMNAAKVIHEADNSISLKEAFQQAKDLYEEM
ncbi:hypothetical protein CF326_g7758 [Tilletia indica]|nr:hypothetical protein CF326_g7758 [Tilletia indica]